LYFFQSRFDVPATVAGRVVVAISNIFSVAVFAIPAGILASGFEPVGEEMIKSREKKLRERQSMLRRLNARARIERKTLEEGDYARDDTVSAETVLIGKSGDDSDAAFIAGKRRNWPVHLTETPADSDHEDDDSEDSHFDSDEDLHYRRRKSASTTITVRRFAKRVGRVIEVDNKAQMPYFMDRLTVIFGTKINSLLDRHNGIVSEVHHLVPGRLYVAVTEAELSALESQT
jgi:hypothetical protein